MSTHRSLRDALDDYLALRRVLGFKLANAGRLLGQFVQYLDEHGISTPTTDHALAWGCTRSERARCGDCSAWSNTTARVLCPVLG